MGRSIGVIPLVFVLVSVLACGIYVHTLSPTITWGHDGADSGDFAAAVATGGVPHPPGYPTYLLLAELFRQLPWGDVAYRLNLLSAVTAALAAGLIALVTSLTIRHGTQAAGATERPIWGLILAPTSAGLVFAFSPVVWSQAVIGEVYALHACLSAGLLALGLWARWRKEYGLVFLSFLCLGLAMGNHLTSVLFLPVLLCLTWDLVRPNAWKFILHTVPGLTLGLAVYLALPVRAAAMPPINWGGASDWRGLWWMLSGQLYREFVLALPLAYLPMRLLFGLRTLFVSMNGLGLPLGLLGLTVLLERDRRVAVSTALAFVLYSGYATLYNTSDSYVYLIPALVVFAVWMGYGLHELLKAAWAYVGEQGSHRAWLRTVLPVAVLLFAVAGVPWHWHEEDLSTNTEALDYALNVLDRLEPNSLVVVDGDAHTFALWYARYGLGHRRDVAVVNDGLVPFDWYRATLQKHHPEVMSNADPAAITDLFPLLEANIGRRPVYFSDKPDSLPFGYEAVASGNLWQMVRNGDDRERTTSP